MKSQANRRRSIKDHRKVRMSISLNKVNPVKINYFMIANDEWTKNWLEQVKEMLPDHTAVNYVSTANSRYIVEWWEN